MRLLETENVCKALTNHLSMQKRKLKEPQETWPQLQVMSDLSIFTALAFALRWKDVRSTVDKYLQGKYFHFWGTKQISHKGKACSFSWTSHFPGRIYFMSGGIITVWSFLFRWESNWLVNYFIINLKKKKKKREHTCFLKSPNKTQWQSNWTT